MTFFRLYALYRRFGHTPRRSIAQAWRTMRRTY